MMYPLNYISTWPDFTWIQIEKGLVSAPYDVLQMSPSALLMLKIWETFWDFCEAIECKLKPGIVSYQKQLRRLQKLTEQLTKQSPHKVHSVAVLELLDGSDLPHQTESPRCRGLVGFFLSTLRTSGPCWLESWNWKFVVHLGKSSLPNNLTTWSI